MAHEAAKRAAARTACGWINDGMTLGLGTGSTAQHVVERVAELVAEGMELTCVATSKATAREASKRGVRLVELDEVESIDLCLDGTDEADGQGNLIKGGGGALTREKLVAITATEMIVVADETKVVERLGLSFDLPVEILPFGVTHTLRRLAAFGKPALRKVGDSDNPFVTDNSNYICDLHTPDGIAAADAARIDAEIKALHGVVECGLFTGIATRIVVGSDDRQSRVLEF